MSSTFTQSQAAQPDATANAPGDECLLVLKGITELIKQAKRLNLSECAFLLGMAQIGLQTKIHNISDEEMDAFLEAVRESMERR